jgi:hypothetical protein
MGLDKGPHPFVQQLRADGDAGLEILSGRRLALGHVREN